LYLFEILYLGGHRDKILVEVSFTATKPISFTSKIDFFDNEKHVFSVPISGTSENSMFTVYPFLKLRSGRYDISGKSNGTVVLVERPPDPKTRPNVVVVRNRLMLNPTMTYVLGTGTRHYEGCIHINP
jgi:hypothetical protein